VQSFRAITQQRTPKANASLLPLDHFLRRNPIKCSLAAKGRHLEVNHAMKRSLSSLLLRHRLVNVEIVIENKPQLRTIGGFL
jgi:hypothetical protein